MSIAIATATATATRKPRRKPGEPLQPLTMPFTIIQDTREISGGGVWTFTGITGDSGDKFRPLIVPTEIATLHTGDYSLKGFEDVVTVERKSAADLFGTLAGGRERFEAEHVRMMDFRRAVVVIESDWATMLATPPYPSRLSPLSVFRTAISWLVKYNVPWIACPGRRYAELWTFQFLRKFYEATIEQQQTKAAWDNFSARNPPTNPLVEEI
jgi:ERCC4-type nuclease